LPIAITEEHLALQASIRGLSIAAGTTQILLSLVAERLLGLPQREAR